MTRMLSHGRLFATSWTVAYQAPLSMEFSRQKYWSGLLFPSPGYLPDPGIEPMHHMSPALTGMFFTTSPPERSYIGVHWLYNPQYISQKPLHSLIEKQTKKPS